MTQSDSDGKSKFLNNVTKSQSAIRDTYTYRQGQGDSKEEGSALGSMGRRLQLTPRRDCPSA